MLRRSDGAGIVRWALRERVLEVEGRIPVSKELLLSAFEEFVDLLEALQHVRDISGTVCEELRDGDVAGDGERVVDAPTIDF
jgi:hypothetical protein